MTIEICSEVLYLRGGYNCSATVWYCGFMIRDGKKPELSKNQPNQNPCFAKNRNRKLRQMTKNPNRTRTRNFGFLPISNYDLFGAQIL